MAQSLPAEEAPAIEDDIVGKSTASKTSRELYVHAIHRFDDV